VTPVPSPAAPEFVVAATAAGPLHGSPARFDLAIVRAARLDGYEVLVGDTVTLARRAVGCLVAPEPGDEVLVVREEDRAFILSVLTRLVMSSVELSVPVPGVALRLRAGEVAIEAERGLRLTAPAVTIGGRLVTLFGETLGLAATALTALADRFRVTATRHETLADEVSTSARQRTTVVKGADVETVGLSSKTVESASLLRAENAVVYSRKDLRIDGERITMG
jgi:hypothetical protein